MKKIKDLFKDNSRFFVVSFWVMFILFLLFLLLCSCAPVRFSARIPEKIIPEEIEEYKIDLNSIPKPEPIVRKYAAIDEDGGLFYVSTPDSASVFVIYPKEYAKINALKELALTYKGIIGHQEDLVNQQIEIRNSLEELLALEREAIIVTTKLWEDSENTYRKEKYYHTIDNIIDRGSLYMVTIGIIYLLIQVAD